MEREKGDGCGTIVIRMRGGKDAIRVVVPWRKDYREGREEGCGGVHAEQEKSTVPRGHHVDTARWDGDVGGG